MFVSENYRLMIINSNTESVHFSQNVRNIIWEYFEELMIKELSQYITIDIGIFFMRWQNTFEKSIEKRECDTRRIMIDIHKHFLQSSDKDFVSFIEAFPDLFEVVDNFDKFDYVNKINELFSEADLPVRYEKEKRYNGLKSNMTMM